MSKGRKILMWILGILLVIIIAAVIFISGTAKKNLAAMDECIDAVLTELKANYTVTERDPGEYKNIKLYGIMNCDVEQYDVEGLGNLCIMRVDAVAMQMSCIIMTPQDRNLPLFSTDYMYMLGNRIAYLEFYDVVEEKDDTYMKLMNSLNTKHEEYSHLEDASVSEAWYQDLITSGAYKKGTTAQDGELKNILMDSYKLYIDHAKSIEELSEASVEKKLAITKEYTDGLVDKGGISTDVFKQQLGNDKTKDFFDKVFFGTSAR